MSDLDDLAAAAEGRSGEPQRRGLPPFPPPAPDRFAQQQPSNPSHAGAYNYTSVPVPAGMERCWHVHDAGQQYGPHTESELATLVAVGTISPAAMAWRTGSPRWIPISSVVPMPAYMPQQQTYSGSSRHAPPQSSNRIGVGLVAIFLGWLGIHKFMLGYTNAGVVMLLVSIFGAFALGLGPSVMFIIGFIEGIVYLTKTDAQFHREYVVNQRHWF